MLASSFQQVIGEEGHGKRVTYQDRPLYPRGVRDPCVSRSLITGESQPHGPDEIASEKHRPSRPGADEVTEEEELSRVLPVVQGMCGAGITVSVDTRRASVAAAAIAAGAHLVNDVSGGEFDPAMLKTVAEAGVPLVMMHMRWVTRLERRRGGERRSCPDPSPGRVFVSRLSFKFFFSFSLAL